MATVSGRLATIKPAAATWKTLIQPVTNVVVCYVGLANQATTDDNFRIAVISNALADQTPNAQDLIAGSLTVGAGSLIKACGDSSFMDKQWVGPIELNPANNDQIVVYSVNGNVSFVATGDAGAV